MTEEMIKQFQETMKNLIPQVQSNRNGYEIRLEMLKLAKDMEEMKTTYEFEKWKSSFSVIDGVMTLHFDTPHAVPQIPTLDDVMKGAERMREFVDNATTNYKK